MSKPAWGFWNHVPRTQLWRAVALSCDIEPRLLESFSDDGIDSVSGSGAGEAFWDRLAIAKAHIGERGFPPVTVHRGDPANSSVKIGDFAGWVVSKRWEIPEEMRALAAPEQQEVPVVGRWPWGDHETELLRNLAAAAKRFWSNYDPTDPSTAPTNKQVSDWLVESQGVAPRTAEIIAEILRADGMRPGPRK